MNALSPEARIDHERSVRKGEKNPMELLSSVLKIAPHLSLVFTTFSTACCIFVGRVILIQGINVTVFLVYQFSVSTLSLSLLAFIFERKRIPPLSVKILLEIFFLALLGMTFAQFMYVAALYYVPSTIESTSLNLCPAVTYLICLIIGQEKLQIQTLWGSGKILGTLISISGASCLLFWTGSSSTLATTDNANWTIGLLLLAGGVLANCIWCIMLGAMTRRYPAEMSLTAIMMFFATIQMGAVAAAVNHRASQWRLNSSLELLNILMGGTLTTGLVTFLSAWSAGIKGPVFVTSFNPLGVLFTAILELLFLGSRMSIASVFGSILIVLGLYVYLWSKSKEEENQKKDNPHSGNTTYLLG